LKAACTSILLLTLALGCAGSTSEPVRVASEAAKSAVCSVDGVATQLHDGVAFLQPGFTGCLQVQIDGDRLVPIAFVSEATDETLVLKAWASGDSVYLSVTNPFSSHVKYRAGMLLPGEERFRSTSSCPVIGGGGAFEHWPHPIEALAFRDFVLLGDGAQMVCD